VTTHPPSSGEVEGGVELYFYSPFGPSWPVIGRTFIGLPIDSVFNTRHLSVFFSLPICLNILLCFGQAELLDSLQNKNLRNHITLYQNLRFIIYLFVAYLTKPFFF
jgi:hypothetical protein